MTSTSPQLRYAGLALSALVTLFLLADSVTSFIIPPSLAAEMATGGWPLWTAHVTGTIALIAALLYALPRTAPLGALLITGFLGGAIAAHLRLGEIGSPPQLICLVAGLAAWIGLWLRDERVRALLSLANGM